MFCNWISNTYTLILVVISSFVISAHSDVPRPRGVSLAKASLYSPTKDFTCFDGTVTIPFNFVNDDYCDCFDGSDEPGTAACLNGVFHCTNAGHRPQNLPSSRVNDGICDCCDGTDEYATIECGNTCDELGREARAEAIRKSELLKAGSVIRAQLIEQGNKRRNEMAEQLNQLEMDKTEADKIKEEKESIKSDYEVKENEVLRVYREAEEEEKIKKQNEERLKDTIEPLESFAEFDTNKDGQLTIAEIQTINVFDKNKDGEVSEDEVKYFLGEEEFLDLGTFTTVTWPLLKPFMMAEQGLFKREPLENQEDQDEHEEEDIDEEARESDNEVANEDSDEHNEETDIPESSHKTYDEETQMIVDAANDARRQVLEAERTVREIESNIKTIQANLEKDYGPQQEYVTLENQCFEYEDKEYVYKLCMFQKVTQRAKSGGNEVGLGNWGEWAEDQGNPYAVMMYTNGMGCWNGPSRKTTVYIQCGLETKVLSVSEPHRCEYKMELTTPAACDDTKLPEHSVHDEL